MTNRRLPDGSYCDDTIKPQGLVGKYTIPPLLVPPPDNNINNDIDNIDVLANVPQDVLPPDSIDSIVNDEDYGIDEMNEFITTASSEELSSGDDDSLLIEYAGSDIGAN